jgi:D-glycero-alpha-D-manno-heptose-7-phosphate kinase
MKKMDMQMSKIFRSKAPFRISFGGGGTDMTSYSAHHTGAVINATIHLFTHTSLELRDDTKITFKWVNKDEFEEHDFSNELDCSYGLKLFKATHNHIFKTFKLDPIGYDIVSYQDVPTGSGLGTSSSLIVSLIGVYMELFNLPLGEYDIAEMAIKIERIDLAENGGKQDQYAAAFGGWNYMEFKGDDVIVNPLRIKDKIQNELANNVLLYYTNFSRKSTNVLEEQVKKIKDNNKTSLISLHSLVNQAKLIKDSLMKGNIDDLGEILDYGFQQKKMLAKGISTPEIELLYETALKAGATGGKISGAGGGGFMFLYCPNNTKYDVMSELDKLKIGYYQPYTWTQYGLRTWQIG